MPAAFDCVHVTETHRHIGDRQETDVVLDRKGSPGQNVLLDDREVDHF